MNIKGFPSGTNDQIYEICDFPHSEKIGDCNSILNYKNIK